MAQRRRRRQSNPSGGSGMTLLLLAGAGFLAYEYFFNNPSTAVAATTAPPTQAQALAAQIASMIAANPNDPSILSYIGQLSALSPSAGIQMQGALVAARQASPSGQAALAQSSAGQLAIDMGIVQAQHPDWTPDQVAVAAQQLQTTQAANSAARQAAAYAAAAQAAGTATPSGVSGLNPMYESAWG